MNTYGNKKRIFVALALSFALFATHKTYPVFDWLDNLRDKLSEPIMDKVVKKPDKAVSPLKQANTLNRQPNRQNRRNMVKNNVVKNNVVRNNVRQPVIDKTNKAEPEKAPTSLALDIAQMVTHVYCTEGIETPINRIGASAAVKTGFSWFGRNISSRQAFSTLAKDVLISSVMFSVHNLAAYFLYPNWLKDRWWMKGFANNLCGGMVMGLASSLFGVRSE